MVKKVTFKISPQGEVSVEADGFTGNACEAFTAPFEELLGKVETRDVKDVYYQNELEGNQTENKTE